MPNTVTISEFTFNNGSTYVFKDAVARAAIDNLNSFEYTVCTSASNTPKDITWNDITGTLNPSEDTKYRIYLVPSTNGTDDIYDEYLTIQNGNEYLWEKIGNTDVNLGNYALKDETVSDVQVNGTSVVTNGVANVPIGGSNTLGVVKTASGYGISINSGNGVISVDKSGDSLIKLGNENYRPIVPSSQHRAAFYGLAKAAGDTTQSQSNNAVGTYTDEAKSAIRTMIGAASVEDIPDAPVQDVQVNGTSVTANGVANIPQASNTVAGVLKTSTTYGTAVQDGYVYLVRAISSQIKDGAAYFNPIVPNLQHESTFYGLAKAAGADEKNSTLSVGQYSDNAKTAIKSMLGVTDPTVSDVQVAGTSVVQNGVANVPIASADNVGVVKVGSSMTIGGTGGAINFAAVGASEVKNGTVYNRALTPERQHASAFYGLAKAAGADEKDSTLPVGSYTETAKTAIRNMLGATSSDVVAIQDEQPTNADTKVWLPESQAIGVEVPTMTDLDNYVQKTDYATGTTAGIVFTEESAGLGITAAGKLFVSMAVENLIKTGSSQMRPIVPVNQHQAVFYGLAKAAGDTTQSASNNAVGTYTADASAAIRNMLGAVGKADYPSNGGSIAGIVKVDNSNSGVSISGSNTLILTPITDAAIKNGTTAVYALNAQKQHQSVFYGLAKAAGDATQSASSNAVGTYTAEAKSAIQSMLGIDLQSIASEVEIPLVETVTGSTPSITGQPNTRYNCGEVSTISITPPSAGSIDVIFESGSTAAVLTVPNTVKFPAWFDATALEADTIYEILITDGVYGSVMTWAN